MKAIFPFIIPTDIKIDLNVATILQGEHCTVGVIFVMFVIKLGGTVRDGESHMWPGSRAHLRALEAPAFFILNMHSPAFLSTL